jgi:hypothetical protein
MRLDLAVLALWGLLAFSGSAVSAAAPCLNGLGPALLAGGFSGSIDCENDHLSVRYVGLVQKFGRTFQVYAYRYRLKPACPECAVHGGQRVIFIERGRYVGQYKPDFMEVATRHGELIFKPTEGWGDPVTVEFTLDGPPKRLWVGGEVLGFFR